jgi:uncharacterized protein (DUF1778 family)
MSIHSAPNDARLDFRLPAELKQTIEQAAVCLGQSVSDFAASTLVQTAWSVIEQDKKTRLSNRDRDLFLALLDQKHSRPTRALTFAARKYKASRRSAN